MREMVSERSASRVGWCGKDGALAVGSEDNPAELVGSLHQGGKVCRFQWVSIRLTFQMLDRKEERHEAVAAALV